MATPPPLLRTVLATCPCWPTPSLSQIPGKKSSVSGKNFGPRFGSPLREILARRLVFPGGFCDNTGRGQAFAFLAGTGRSHVYAHWFSEVRSPRVYAGGAAGRHCHYRHPRGLAAARRSAPSGSGPGRPSAPTTSTRCLGDHPLRVDQRTLSRLRSIRSRIHRDSHLTELGQSSCCRTSGATTCGAPHPPRAGTSDSGDGVV